MIDDIPGQSHRHIFALLDGLNRRGERQIRRLLETTGVRLRGSYGRLLSLIPNEGARPSHLAGGWATRQAVGARLKEMEKIGWVRTRPDPNDGRAVLVHVTAAGQRMLEKGEAAIAALESDWADLVGPERYATFRSVLSELAEGYVPTLTDYPDDGSSK